MTRSGSTGAWPALVPVFAWAVAATLFSVVGTESLLGALPGQVATQARITAYVSVAVSICVTGGLGVLFALAAGVMLWWIESPIEPLSLLTAVASGYWIMGGYCLLLVAAVALDPPSAPSLQELLSSPDLAELAQGEGRILGRLISFRLAASAISALVVWYPLSRSVGVPRAALAVAAGASVVAFATATLSRLATLYPL